MFRFEHPIYLYALLALPLLALYFYWKRKLRRKALDRFGEYELVSKLMPEVSLIKHQMKFIILLLVLTLLIVAWANPQWGTHKEKVTRRSSDVFIAIDISQSMLAEDVLPSRLEYAKSLALKVVDELRGERMGLILFAGHSYLQMPLTTDYSAAELFIKSANTDQAPTQGTAIGEVIDMATHFFHDTKQHKALIIITDGESFDEGTEKKAEKAGDDGMIIFTIGIGSKEGAKIPAFNGATDAFKLDAQGNPVITKINENLLRDLAKKSNGVYFSYADANHVAEALQKQIDKLEKQEYEQRIFSEFDSKYSVFAGIAFLILILEFVIPYRKSAWLEDRDIFK